MHFCRTGWQYRELRLSRSDFIPVASNLAGPNATVGWDQKPGQIAQGGAPMTRMFVRHTVKDYPVWRKSYDAFDTKRRSMGVTAHGVYRAIDNDNDITAWHDFASPEQAMAFVRSDELKNAMKTAGVKGAPTIWITTS